MKYSEYLTMLLGKIKQADAQGEIIYLCNQTSHHFHAIYTRKLRLFIAKRLKQQEKEFGVDTTTLSPLSS